MRTPSTAADRRRKNELLNDASRAMKSLPDQPGSFLLAVTSVTLLTTMSLGALISS